MIIGLVIAVIGGTLIEKLHMEKYVEDFIQNASHVDIDSPTLTRKDRIQYAKDQVMETFKESISLHHHWRWYWCTHS